MKALLLFVLLAGIPRAAFTQAAGAGSVTDPSDTAIPGAPGVFTNVDDTVTGTATTPFPIHGGRTNEGRLSLGLHGVTAATPLTKVYDAWGVIGGPIMKDGIWYFANAHVGRVYPRSPVTRRDWGSIDLLIGPEWTCGRNYSMRRPVASVSYHGAP